MLLLLLLSNMNNVLTQLFVVALDVLFAPYSGPGTPKAPTPTTPPPLPLPVALLRDAGIETCRPGLLKMGDNAMKVSLMPRGSCRNCCPVKAFDVRFVLFTKDGPANGVLIERLKPGMARQAGVDAAHPTEIFVHGFTEPSPGESGKVLVDAYLSRTDRKFNVVLLDWSNLCPFPWYRNAVENVKIAAKALTRFLEVFDESGEIPLSSVHIIGFSLGSHIASFTGKFLKPTRRLARITALDPAFPEYSLRDPSGRLTRSDANYVDVIHTDAGIFGLPIPVGHADFYPNGGRALQPGCQPSYLVQIKLVNQIFACSHVRAWRLYAESVRNFGAFPATRCPIWRGPDKQCNFTADAIMGYSSKNTTKGQFYLITNHDKPFSKTAIEQQRL